MSFKSYFYQIFACVMSKMGFTLAWYVQQQVFATLTMEMSCILYFFRLGKNMKKSFWSHLSALFWLSKHENIAEALDISISLKSTRIDIYPVYIYPFFRLG